LTLSGENVTEINPVEKYFAEKTSEANYGLWNALLTINGIFISAFSLGIAFSTRFNIALTSIFVSFCSISMLLILWNYISTKNHYLKAGKILGNLNYKLKESKQKTNVDSSIRRHKHNIYRENIVIVFLLIEIGLICFIVYNV